MPNRTEILKVIADNPELLAAVRETVEAQFTLENLPTNGLTDVGLGELVRARVTGKQFVAKAFAEIERYKTRAGRTETGENPAR